MIKSFRNHTENIRFFLLNRSNRSDRGAQTNSPSAPLMRVPNLSNQMILGGPLDAQRTSYPKNSKQSSNHAIHLSHTALALSVSAAALSLSLASSAQAQNTIPEECTAKPSPLAPGGTLTCLLNAPAEIGPIVTAVDGITIIIGDDSNPTTVRNIDGSAITSTLARGSREGLNIDSTNGSVTGNTHGIYARNNGSGSVVINADTVSGILNDGIAALSRNNTITGNVSITASGTVTGGNHGIRAENLGTGRINITTTADVSGRSGIGISAYSNAGSITIRDAHTVTGADGHGIYADSNGGNITIQGCRTRRSRQ